MSNDARSCFAVSCASETRPTLVLPVLRNRSVIPVFVSSSTLSLLNGDLTPNLRNAGLRSLSAPFGMVTVYIFVVGVIFFSSPKN